MRKLILATLLVALSNSGFCKEACCEKRSKRGEAAGYASRDATVVSMMGWGLGLAVGIATLCALIENNPANTAH